MDSVEVKDVFNDATRPGRAGGYGKSAARNLSHGRSGMRPIDADDFLRGIEHDHSPAAYWVRRLIEQARTIAPPSSRPAKPLGGEAATGLSRPEGGTRLDRRRWEGCPVCAARGCGTCLHRSHDKSQYPCRDCAKSGKFEPIWYCPSCGKPQTELAWAELERRIGGNDGTTNC